MALRKFVDRLTKPVEELDRAAISRHGATSARRTPLDAVRTAPSGAGRGRGALGAHRAAGRRRRARGHGQRRPRRRHGGVPRPAQDPRRLARPPVVLEGVVTEDGRQIT